MVEPGADFLLQLLDGRVAGFARLHRGDLLDLGGEPLGFLALLGEPQFGLLPGGVDEPVDALLERFKAGLVGKQAVFEQWVGR